MKKTLIAALIFIAPGVAYSDPSASQKDLIKYLIGPEEPTIKDASWSTDTNLYVGVVDDGSDRTGLAEYVCLTAKERGAPAEMVKVIDVVKVVREGKFEELGKSYCR